MKKEELKVSSDGRWILVGDRIYPHYSLQRATKIPTGMELRFTDTKVNSFGEIIDRNSVTLARVEDLMPEELLEMLTDKRKDGI